MLVLYNKGLQGIDPYDPELTPAQKMDIIKECTLNIWYYLREVVRIPDVGGTYERFKLDVSVTPQIYTALIGIDSWVTKPRLTRKTVNTLVIINHQRLFGGFIDHKNLQRIRFCSTNRENARQLKNRMKFLTDCLPVYIQNMDCDKYKCINTDTPIGLVKSEQKAVEIGSKFYDTMIYFNEAEYIPEIASLYMASRKPFLSSSIVAKHNNIISTVLFESVISDDTTATELLDKCTLWIDKYYDLSTEDLKEIVKRFPYQIIHIYTTYTELGLNNDWFERMCKALNNDEDVIRRELLLTRKNETE